MYVYINVLLLCLILRNPLHQDRHQVHQLNEQAGFSSNPKAFFRATYPLKKRAGVKHWVLASYVAFKGHEETIQLQMDLPVMVLYTCTGNMLHKIKSLVSIP